MIVKHFFITDKNKDAIVDLHDNKLMMGKISKRKSKIYLSSIDMKTGVIHNKSTIFGTVELVPVNNKIYALKSKDNGFYYTNEPLTESKLTSPIQVNRNEIKEWELFNLKKSKNIIISDNIKEILQ